MNYGLVVKGFAIEKAWVQILAPDARWNVIKFSYHIEEKERNNGSQKNQFKNYLFTFIRIAFNSEFSANWSICVVWPRWTANGPEFSSTPESSQSLNWYLHNFNF